MKSFCFVIAQIALFLAGHSLGGTEVAVPQLSNSQLAERIAPFYKALETKNWAQVNLYLAPELHEGGKFVYDQSWSLIPNTFQCKLDQIVRMSNSLEGSASEESLLCLILIQKPAAPGSLKPEPMTRLDVWRLQKGGELVVTPQEFLNTSGIHLASLRDKPNESVLFDSLEAISAASMAIEQADTQIKIRAINRVKAKLAEASRNAGK